MKSSNFYFLTIALIFNVLLVNAQISCPNLVTNGDFESGNTGFTSALAVNCACIPSSYCVNKNFNLKCVGSPNFKDHTSNAGNFLIIDGNTGGAADVWTTTVTANAGDPYTFSFWVASVYPTAQQVLDLGMMVNGVNVNQVTVSQTTPSWVQYSFSGVCPVNNPVIAIRQLSGGEFRDFGIDDISFTSCACVAAFTSTSLSDCGKVQFNNQSVSTPGQFYCWDFDGNLSTCESLDANPIWQFPTCGTHTVCLTVVGNGCFSKICKTITVTDTIRPTAICKPSVDVILNANCQFQITSTLVEFGSTDNCQIKAISVSPTTITNCGTSIITMTVIDGCNNQSTCTTRIQAKDTFPPTIICPQNTTIACNKDTMPSITGFPTATDNCSGVVKFTRSDIVSGNIPCDATIKRTWTATDSCGNTASCIQTIFIRDTVQPIVSNCPPNQIVNTNAGTCFFTYPFPLVINATDNCDPNPTAICIWSDPSGVVSSLTAQSQFPKGVNRISCSAKDKCGNIGQICSFTLTVVDNQKPTITCPLSIIVDSNAIIQCKATVNGLAPTVTDNCTGGTVNYTITGTNTTPASGANNASGTMFANGTSTVVYTATDMGGNTASCSFKIDVKCVSGVGDISDKMPIHIFPNPNTGVFSFDLPIAATSDMTFRVTDHIGRVVLEKKIENGSTQQNVEAKTLPKGLYFLQVVSGGKVIAIEQFVKQ